MPFTFSPSAVRGKSADEVDAMYGNGEKTEILPDGVPVDSTVLFKDESADTVYLTGNNGGSRQMSWTADLDTTAYYFAQAQRMDLFPFMAKFQVDDARYGALRKVSISAKLNDTYSMDDEMRETHKPAGSGVSLDKIKTILPDGALEKFEKKVNELLESFKNRKPSDFVDPADQPDKKPPPKT
jgi:hypothetical protein